MSKVLVLYPRQFNCYAKFYRKLESIFSSMQNIDLLYLHDENNLIKQYSEESHRVSNLKLMHDLSSFTMTHAIVFDDGEEFPNEVKKFKESGAVSYTHLTLPTIYSV